MSHADRIAKDIFSRYGVNVNIAVRGTGWSNATWLTDELVLRVSDREGDERLRREAQVTSFLPGEIGYPRILEFGVTDGYEWSLSKKIEGESLGKVWYTLTSDQRMKALSQLWQKAELVHSVDTNAENVEPLYGYTIYLELWILEDRLAHPEGEGPIEQWDPYRRLQSLAEGHGGYLSKFKSRIKKNKPT